MEGTGWKKDLSWAGKFYNFDVSFFPSVVAKDFYVLVFENVELKNHN